jgi:hypothetical protein
MHQSRIELVEVGPDLVEPGLEWQQRFISLEEGAPKRPEHCREGKLDLPVPAIDGRIHETGDPVAADENVPRPQIAVEQARRIGLEQVLLEARSEPFDAAAKGRRQLSLGFGGSRHRQQPLVAKEWDPAIGPRIGLGQWPDQRVALIAERLMPSGMKTRNQFRRMALDLRRNAAPVVVDVVHDEEIRLPHMHCRNRQV